MIVELHCHTSNYSACSHVNAVELIKHAFNLGLQAIVLTDHHYQWKDEDLLKIKHEAGLPDYFHVLSGQEFKTSDYGDVLIYGVKETIEKQKLTLEEVREKFPDSAIVWAHPYRHNNEPEKDKLLNPLFDAIEIFSSNYTVVEASRALKDYHELKFTAIAGTDTHAITYTGSYPTVFDHPFTTIEEMVEEIKKGRCRPYFVEAPKAGTTDLKVTEISMGNLSTDKKQEIVVKTFDDIESWKEGERSFHIIKEIYKRGFDAGRYRIAKPLDKDEKNLSLIEERVKGKILYDVILNSDEESGKNYLKYTAQWLAALHNNNLHITPKREYHQIEKERLEYYISGMYEEKHKHTPRVQLILDEVWRNEDLLLNDKNIMLVQGHGDFHPKNIFIGEDEKTEEEFVSAIDFNSSFQLPKAFDVGTFLAQYRNMFFDKPEILRKIPGSIFLQEYLIHSDVEDDFLSQVHLYKARTFLSVIYYLVKVGKGNSENFWTILVEAERSLANMSYSRKMTG